MAFTVFLIIFNNRPPFLLRLQSFFPDSLQDSKSHQVFGVASCWALPWLGGSAKPWPRVVLVTKTVPLPWTVGRQQTRKKNVECESTYKMPARNLVNDNEYHSPFDAVNKMGGSESASTTERNKKL